MNIDEGLFCSSSPLWVWQGPRKFPEPYTGLLYEWWRVCSAWDNWRYLCPFAYLRPSLKVRHILAAWYNAFKWQKSAHESSFTLLIIINYSYIQNALAHKLQRLGPYIISHCYCFHSHWVNAFLVHKEPTVVQTAFCFPALLKEAIAIQANLIKGLNRRAYYR